LPPKFDPDGQKPLFLDAELKNILTSHTEGDIRDLNLLKKVWADSQAEVFFHLAAQALVRESYQNPLDTFNVNTLGTASVLEAVRLTNRPAVVVVITSDKCYQNFEQIWGYREIDPLGGSDPYSASKGAAEIVAQSYRDSFFPPDKLDSHGVRLATVRAGNVIGGGDWAEDRLVPDIVRALIKQQTISVRNPRAIRPWQHVLEPLSGYLFLAEKLLTQPQEPLWCSAWNFGPEPGDIWSVARMAESFCNIWGPDSHWVDVSDKNAFPEAGLLSLSIERARNILGWSPRWTTEMAIDRTAKWYKASIQDGFKALKACQTDIVRYLEVH
jgi:CDP-glucose 4,6-dehydratase